MDLIAQEGKMKGYGLLVKAINAITKMEMEQEGKHIWKHVEPYTTVLLISPEMLATSGFQQLLQTNKFKNRIYTLIIDEIHLLISWKASFHPLFQQIVFLHAWFPSDTVLLGLTATLQKGKYTDSIFKFLCLQASKVYFIWWLNVHPDVQIQQALFRVRLGSSWERACPKFLSFNSHWFSAGSLSQASQSQDCSSQSKHLPL